MTRAPETRVIRDSAGHVHEQGYKMRLQGFGGNEVLQADAVAVGKLVLTVD
jgi:hypothetical protein